MWSVQCWFTPECILISVSLDGGTGKGWEQTMRVAAPSPAPGRQGTAESMGLSSYSHMTLCGSKQIWKAVTKLAEEACKAQCKLRNSPSSAFFWGLLFSSQHQTSLLSLLILCGGCLCEQVGGLRLHLLMEIALTFIFICWPDCYPVPEAECGYTFLLKLACLV